MSSTIWGGILAASKFCHGLMRQGVPWVASRTIYVTVEWPLKTGGEAAEKVSKFFQEPGHEWWQIGAWATSWVLPICIGYKGTMLAGRAIQRRHVRRTNAGRMVDYGRIVESESREYRDIILGTAMIGCAVLSIIGGVAYTFSGETPSDGGEQQAQTGRKSRTSG